MFSFTWRKFPNYRQQESMDCGATCLKMICAYYGKQCEVEYLRKICFQGKSGVSLLGIKHGAKSLGFNSIGIKCTIDELRSMHLPCILHWNQSHFVVLYKVSKTQDGFVYYVSDPIGYRFKYTDSEIQQCWLNPDAQTGMILCLKPNSDFETGVHQDSIEKNNYTWLVRHLKGFSPHIFNIALGMLFCSLMLLIFPFLTQSIVDYGVAHESISFVITILIAQVILIVSSNLIDFIRNWLLLHIGMKINISIISEFILKLTNLPIAFFDTRMVGDIIQRIGDHTRIKDFLTDISLNFIFSIITVIVFGVVLFLYNTLIFTIFFLGSILYILWVSIFMRQRAILDNKMFAQNAATQSNIYELIYGMQEIKLNGCEDQKRWNWEKIQVKIYKLIEKNLALSQYQASGALIINQIKNAIITAFVATYTIKGEMTLGMLIAIQFIIGQLNSPIEQLVTFMKKLQDTKLSIARLNSIYEIKDEVTKERIWNQAITRDSIVFSNVYFKYDKLSENYTIKGVSFTIPKGKCTAIVGLSGSGKTTLLKMILGFYEPDSGEILIGANNLNQFNLVKWRQMCGTVMQDGYIFSDTIASNIAPGRESDINMDQVRKAAQIANIDSLIESLPEGYQTVIGNDAKV